MERRRESNTAMKGKKTPVGFHNRLHPFLHFDYIFRIKNFNKKDRTTRVIVILYQSQKI